MKNTKRWALWFGMAAMFACAIFLTGCGEDSTSPVAPGGTGTNPGALQYVLDNYDDPFGAALDAKSGDAQLGAGSWTLSTSSDTAFVGKAGGTITLKFGGMTSTLKVPADAVCASGGSCVVKITATAAAFQTPLGLVVLYEFGPDGLKFAKPCELKVFAGFVPGQLVSLVWFNPATGLWELQQVAKVYAHGELKFTITHFSKYGISCK